MPDDSVPRDCAIRFCKVLQGIPTEQVVRLQTFAIMTALHFEGYHPDPAFLEKIADALKPEMDRRSRTLAEMSAFLLLKRATDDELRDLFLAAISVVAADVVRSFAEVLLGGNKEAP